MSNKNRDFKKLLATLCGVASTLGGGATSAKGNTDIIGYVRQNKLKSGLIAGGSVAVVLAAVLGGKYLLSKGKDSEEQKEDLGEQKKDSDEQKEDGGIPPHEQKKGSDIPLQSPPPGPLQSPPPGPLQSPPPGPLQSTLQSPLQNPPVKTQTNPPSSKSAVYNFGFDQVNIKNFKKRNFLSESKAGNGMDGTTDNDVKRDGAFLEKLRAAGVGSAYLNSKNFAAFTSKDHSKTIYVVNAPADSMIRSSFFLAANKTKGFEMLSDNSFPGLLFFLAQKGIFGTNWNLLPAFSWNSQGEIVFYTGSKDKAPEVG